eukprot:scaffold47605_cov53-Phaeocystis_antarctica.AAC.1
MRALLLSSADTRRAESSEVGSAYWYEVRRAAADNEAIQLVSEVGDCIRHIVEEAHAYCACPPQVLRACLATQRAAAAGDGWRAEEGVRAHDEREQQAPKMLRWSPRCHGAIQSVVQVCLLHIRRAESR